ncbi:MAG: conjugal transfer protein [Acidimicrobiia bacterium]|nr:conjugal transfer protein [Acidimicrobiia bacterium]
MARDLRGDVPPLELQTPLLARAVGWLLVLGVAAGFAALAVTMWTHGSSETATVTSRGAEDIAAETGPSGWAELYVSEFLAAGQGTEHRLDPYLEAQSRPALAATPNSLYASAVSTLSAEEVEDRYWAVVVAAHVLARNGEADGYRSAGTRYYAVGVHELDGGDGWYSLTLPAEVAPPRQATPDDVRASVFEANPPAHDEAASAAVKQMLAAYLTGAGELDRYVNTAAGLRPLEVPMRTPDGKPTTGAPFSALDVTQVRLTADPDERDGLFAWAELRAQPVHAPDQWQVFQYTLRLQRRADRWEVTDLLPAVPLAERSDPFSTVSGSGRSEE